MCTLVEWDPTLKNGVTDARFLWRLVPEIYYVLKSTLSELNSFAVSETSLLWMSVLTSLNKSLRLFFTKCIMILNLFAATGFCVVFCLGDVASALLVSLTPQLSCA